MSEISKKKNIRGFIKLFSGKSSLLWKFSQKLVPQNLGEPLVVLYLSVILDYEAGLVLLMRCLGLKLVLAELQWYTQQNPPNNYRRGPIITHYSFPANHM